MILIFACMIFATVTSESTTRVKENPPNVGTVLFSASDTDKKQWSKSEVGILQARKYFQSLLPPPIFINTFNEDYVKILLGYFKDAYATIKKEAKDPETDSILTTALSDAIGGYFKVWVLPIAKLDYYGGTISQANVVKLFKFYNEIKRYLDTDGEGWHKPDENILNSVTINVAPLQLLSNSGIRSMKDPCDNLAYFEKTPTGLGIPIPNVNWNDKLSTLFVPLKNASLISMNTPSSSQNLIKYYNAARSCIQTSNPKEQGKFDEKFQKWLIEDVVPHLKDDNLYLALGSVLTLVNKTRDICSDVLDLYVDKCHKCKPKKTLKMPFDITSKKMWILIIILVAEMAWCVPALLFVLCSKKLQQRDCSSNVYLFIDNDKKGKGGEKQIGDPNCPIPTCQTGDLKIFNKPFFDTQGQCISSPQTNTMENETVPCIGQCESKTVSNCVCVAAEPKRSGPCYASKISSLKKSSVISLEVHNTAQMMALSSHDTFPSKQSTKSCLTIRSKPCMSCERDMQAKYKKKRDGDECRGCYCKTTGDCYRKPNGSRQSEECRKLEESTQAKECRKLEKLRKCEEYKKLEERRQAEECKKLKELRQAEECRKLEERRQAEECKKLKELRQVEECRKLEERRQAEECKKLEELRQAEECRKLEERRQAEECKKLKELRQAEECRKLEEQRQAEECKKLEELKQAEECRKLEERRQAEECKKLKELRQAEECRKLEERRQAEECKKLEELRQAEECRKLEERRQAEECKKLEELRQAEECIKLEELRQAEECRKLEERRQAEECKKLEELRQAEECIKLEEQRQAEECKKLKELRQAEECRKLEERRQADECRKLEERRQAEECKKLEELRQAEECRKLEERRQAEECKKLKELRQAEECRKLEERKQAEKCKKLKELRQAEECRKLEERRQAEECKKYDNYKINERRKSADSRISADSKKSADNRKYENPDECKRYEAFGKCRELRQLDEYRDYHECNKAEYYKNLEAKIKLNERRESEELQILNQSREVNEYSGNVEICKKRENESTRSIGPTVRSTGDSYSGNQVKYDDSETRQENADDYDYYDDYDETMSCRQVDSQETSQGICPCTACIAQKSSIASNETSCNISLTDEKHLVYHQVETKSTRFQVPKEFRTKGKGGSKPSAGKSYLEITIDRPGAGICVDMTQCRHHSQSRPSRIPKPATCSIQPYNSERRSTSSSPDKHKSLIPQLKKKTADDIDLGSSQYSKTERKLNGSF